MNIMGINWGDSSTVALLSNNKIKAAIAEERFTRKKNDMTFYISINRSERGIEKLITLIKKVI